jgi:hypothetical protein
MANNYRLIYSAMQFGIAPDGSNNFTAVHGVQSCGLTTNFTLENIFQLGQSSPYEIKEGIPDVQVTLQKVLDGYPLIYHLMTQQASSATMLGRSRAKCVGALATFDDTKDAASGVPIAECILSGLFVNSAAYNFDVNGPFTEDIGAVSNTKLWRDTESVVPLFSGAFNNADRPFASTGSGGVNVRQNFIFADSSAGVTRDANGMVNVTNASVMPPDIDGITSSGTNPLNVTTGSRSAAIQSVQVNCNLNREELLELSRKTPYYRVVSLPVNVTCAITTLAKKWDNVSVNEDTDNLTNRTIKIKVTEGTFIDLGTQNKLSNVDFNGGGADGGNVQLTYNYQTQNDFTVRHPQDPNTALR